MKKSVTCFEEQQTVSEEELRSEAGLLLLKVGLATVPWCHSSLTVKASLLSGRHGNRWICRGPL